MSGTYYADDLGSAVHYALETTHAIAVCLSTWTRRSVLATTRLNAMLSRAPESSSGAMARRGRETPFGKNLDANSARPPTGTVLAASLRTIRGKATGFSAPILPVLLPAMDMSTLCRGLTTNHNLPARAAVISLRLRRRSCGNSQPQS